METARLPSQKELTARLSEAAEQHEVPGAAVGLFLGGDEVYATHGVTSIENPLPVDEDTLFQFGSTGKTFNATAIVRLAEQGRLDLNAPVRTYVPELRLKDEETARNVTVLHLLNHTAGWAGDSFEHMGWGEDAVARFVDSMADLDQVTPLGSAVSYNNAALVLAGRVVERVTGQGYENALRELVIEPIGLENTLVFMDDIMTRRFAVGHLKRLDGSIVVARPWAVPRSIVPAGGLSASVRDQIAWAKFHLGDGRGRDGTQVLSKEWLDRMKEPTVELRPGLIPGEWGGFGIAWKLADLGGVRVVGHGGGTNGQLSTFETVPERDFALASLTNLSPAGTQMNQELLMWALERVLGVSVPQPETDPAPLALSEAQLRDYTGEFRSHQQNATIALDGDALEVRLAWTGRRTLAGEPPEEQQPARAVLVAEDTLLITDGPSKGMRGHFVRDHSGAISGLYFGLRFAAKTR